MQLKKVMDSYEYDTSDDEEWMASKPGTYCDCRYQLNTGLAVRRTQGLKRADVPTTYIPGEQSYDERFMNNVESRLSADPGVHQPPALAEGGRQKDHCRVKQ